MSQAAVDNAKRPRESEEAALAPAIKHAKTTPPAHETVADDACERVWWERVFTSTACKDWSLLRTFEYYYRDDTLLLDSFCDSMIYPTNCPEFDADRVGYCDKLIAMCELEEKDPLKAMDKRCMARVAKYMRNYYATRSVDDASLRASAPTSEGLAASVCCSIRAMVGGVVEMGDSEAYACRGIAHTMLQNALKYAKEYNVSRQSKKDFADVILAKIHGIRKELEEDANTPIGRRMGRLDRASTAVELMRARQLHSFTCDDLNRFCSDRNSIIYIAQGDQDTFAEGGVHYCSVCCGTNDEDRCLVCDDQADKCNCFKQDQSMPAEKRRFTCRCE